MSRPTVWLPIDKLNDPFFNHSGDTFRELVRCWEQKGLVNVKRSDNGYCWLGDSTESDESVLLYDRPTLEWWNKSTPKNYKLALFGNYVPSQTDVARAFPWVFWGRRPMQLELESTRLFSDNPRSRSVTSIFVGKIENSVQNSFRDINKWKSVIEDFNIVYGANTPYKYTQPEYLKALSRSRFGLCLRGYGPKCNREIELMAMGTVPIVTTDVDMKGYFDPPRLGEHYLIARSPSDVLQIIRDTSEKEWQAMSRSCRDWYLRNGSASGSFYQTMRLITTLCTSTLNSIPKSIKEAYSVPRAKLPGVKRIAVDTVFFERTFSGISRVWIGLLREIGSCIGETMHSTQPFEIVLLLRGKTANLPGDLLQRFSFVGIPTFDYATLLDDVEMLNQVCDELSVDLFISTYYTWCTIVPNVVMIHDMIPERFRLPVDAMWKQKTQALANAEAFMCVSEQSAVDLIKFLPACHPDDCMLVPNAFDPSTFEGVDEIVENTDNSTVVLKRLGVVVPFVLTVVGNANHYKNLRLVVDAIRMNPDAFCGHSVVIILSGGTGELKMPPGITIPVVTLRSLTDSDLGVLYSTAGAMIYPSRWEGFGLPVLEAFHFECPVICCTGAGAISEVAGTAARYVNPDRPDELCATLLIVLRTPETNQAFALSGLERLKLFTVTRQFDAFRACISDVLKRNNGINQHQTMSSTSENLPSTTVTSVEAPVDAPTTPVDAPVAPAVAQKPFNGIHLIIQYFNCPDAERQDEFDYCVKANLENSNIVKVHCLSEPNTVIPDWLSSNPKFVEFKVIDRLTYKTGFDYANRFLAGQICAISNLDIFLDPSSKWDALPGLLDMSIVMCLARHEFDGETSTKDKTLQQLAYATAQDCWVFQSPIFVKDCDITIGLLGCDNAIAHRLRISGYIPVNAQDDFKIHHLDSARNKDGTNFLNHHKPNPEQPEERGYRLLPAFGAVQSVDKLLDDLKLGDIHKYLIVCDIMSNFMRLSNPKPEAQTPDPQ